MVLHIRSEIVGRTKTKDAVLVGVAQKHALNWTGRIQLFRQYSTNAYNMFL